MRHTLLLVAALGLIAAAGPSALAQDQDKPSSQPATPTTSEPSTQQPAALPATYAQPAVPGQVVSPYAPAYSGAATPCGYVMPSAHVPGTVMFGSQFPQYGSIPPVPMAMQYGQSGIQYGQPMMQYGQPTTQYGQPTAMPVAGSVAGGVIAQPIQTGTGTLQLNGTTFSGMTYQPTQPGMVFPAGTMGAYSDQPVILTGYSNGYFDPGMTTTTQTGRRGLFGRRR